MAIVGGQAKPVALTECAMALVRACRSVICVGESGPALAREVRSARASTDLQIVREIGALADAVRLANADAAPGDAVVFSPGAPSFDAYANFADRGRHFIELVDALR